MKIPGIQKRVKRPASELFEMTSNCQNFVAYFPDQVKDVSATENSCSFTIENMAKITLKILDKTPFSSVRFKAENDKNIPLFLTLNYTAISCDETDINADVDVEIPIFLKPLLQKPLEDFVNMLSEKIKINAEKN